MDVVARTSLNANFENLRAALSAGPAEWLPGLVETSLGQMTQLRAKTAAGALSRAARIEVGEPDQNPASVVVPIRWEAAEHPSLYPVFDGRLRLYRLAGGGIRLEVRGGYDPPGGALGEAADAAVMRSVAQATLDDFLERVSAVLTRSARSRSHRD